MNELQRMYQYSAPSIELPYCPFCGKKATNRHHIVPRSQGGGDGATVTVCGMGNASGCHGLLHDHKLHMRYTDHWEYFRSEEPVKFQDALEMDGWRPLTTKEAY